MSKSDLKIITIGAGIGGLTFAIAAHQRGIKVQVYERNDTITEVGAGLALGPNSARIIAEDLGLKDELFRISTITKVPHERFYRKFDTSEEFLVLKSDDPKDYTAYNHRADFVKLLASKLPGSQIHLNKKLISIDTEAQTAKFQAQASDGPGEFEEVKYDILIGADGIHSKVRSLLFSQDKPINSFQVMYRDVIDFKDLRGPFKADLTKTTIWLAPGKRHVVTFPIDKSRFAAAAVLPADENYSDKESWKAEGNIDHLISKLGDFHSDVKNIFKSFKAIKIYGLYDREDLDKWFIDKVALLGDAAHPGQPHQGANAGQAIEDGLTLAIILEYAETDPDIKQNVNKWLNVFELSRKKRAEDVVLTSRRMGQIFDKLVDSEKSIKLIEKNFSWIYNHDANAEIEKAIYRLFGPDIALHIDYSHLK